MKQVAIETPMNARGFAAWTYLRWVCGLYVAGALAGCGGNGGSGSDTVIPPSATLQEHREFRAVAGISMGAYGAMNLGTKHSDIFSAIAALGGPVDLRQVLRDVVSQDLDVSAQSTIPIGLADPVSFDHQRDYPGRDIRLEMTKDLVIAFGNPFLHHEDPSRQYLASDSQPAGILRDDEFMAFAPPTNPRGFLDGGDRNRDGLRQAAEVAVEPVDVLLLAGDSLQTIAPGAIGVDVGGRMLADLSGDGVYDVGDGLVVNFSEPFIDTNENLVFEPELGETFEDLGLDGVGGTGDYGEGNGRFDYDPDRAKWLEEDPLTRLAARSAAEIATQRIFMDVGTEDEFGFVAHYDNFVSMLESKGLTVAIRDDFPSNCIAITRLPEPLLLIRYDGGHVGIPEADESQDQLLSGNICGTVVIWQRLLAMISYMDSSFPDGFDGPGDLSLDSLDPRGDIMRTRLPVPSLRWNESSAMPEQEILIYRPPAYFHTSRSFPIVYLLVGYGQRPEDFERLGDMLDPLILTRQMQNMFVVVLPGDGGLKGSFYVNNQVPETQVPDRVDPLSGRYEDAIIQDLMPTIENNLLNGRVRK